MSKKPPGEFDIFFLKVIHQLLKGAVLLAIFLGLLLIIFD